MNTIRRLEWTGAALLLSFLFGFGAAGESAPPQLGSPDWKPTPERPVGWRGDGTGRFPAADPPIQWGRTIRGFYSQLRSTAGKPESAKGKSRDSGRAKPVESAPSPLTGASPSKPAGSGPVGELLNMGFLREWAILGPFDVKDFKTGVDEELIKDETLVMPTIGAAVGQKKWTYHHVSVENQSMSHGKLLVDLALIYGKQELAERQGWPPRMQPWLAYAQTSLWSPAAGKVRLRIDGGSTRKAWLNGVPVKMSGTYDVPPTVDLHAGWNNLVVKAGTTKGAWTFCAHVAPAPPYEYETENIQWMTRMPGPSWCSPIVVGERIFVSADGATLVCVNKADGRVLWMRSTTYYHAVEAAERAKFADLEPKARKLDAVCMELPNLINECVSPDGMKADRNAGLEAKIKEKGGLEHEIQSAMSKADKKQYEAWWNDADWSKYNPTSDGKYVWAAFWGGNKGLGANVLTCFDLNGNRLWSYFCGQAGIGEHGTHSSPALCGNVLVFKSGVFLFGLDKLTGKLLWKVRVNGGVGASTLPVRIGTDVVAYVPQAGLYRPSDGAQLWKATIRPDIPTPTINDGVIYGIGEDQYFAYQLPAQASEGMKLHQAAKASWKEVGYHMQGTFSDAIIGSPLYDRGLIYVASEGGAMNVVDAASGKRVYAQPMDSLNPRLTWVFVVGICSSTTLGGKYIFVRDDQGQTLVLEPGPQYKELGKNLLVEYTPEGLQPESQSNFFFEGQRIYFRTRGFLYCIGKK